MMRTKRESNILGRRGFLNRLISSMLAAVLMLTPVFLAACDSDGEDEVGIADYGTYGMQTAFRFSNRYPFREPFSESERLTGDMIINELVSLGYEPKTQEFYSTLEDGTVLNSRNIYVTIEGSGFYNNEEVEAYKERVPVQLGNETTTTKVLPTLYNKQVIIGTHYDSPTEENSSEYLLNFSGISDNSSGIAAILTTARALLEEEIAYDVTLVFFGAGNADAAGARAFLANMSATDRARTDVVYTAERIYAGDKLYAHAGHSSLVDDKKYEMRRKLYEATDVALEHNLRGTMGVDLVMNQGGYMVDVPGFENRHVYREFTLSDGDYTPFDEIGMPVVFFESAEYDVDRLADVTESEHPAFEATGGMVSGTNFDNTYTLRVSLGSDILEKRINTLAFILVQAIHKGSYSFTKASEVDLGDSSVSPTAKQTSNETSAETAR